MLLICDILYASSYEKSDKNDVLALIGSQKITVKDLNEKLLTLPPDLKSMYETEEGRERLLRELVRIEVFSKEARAIGLDKDKDFRERITKIENALLSREYIRQEMLSGNKEAQDYYEEHLDEFNDPQRMEDFSKEARAIGLDKDKDFRERITKIENALLYRGYIKKKIKARVKVTERVARVYYENHRDEFYSPEKIKVRLIQIRFPHDASPDVVNEKKKLAEETLKRLRKGEDFTKVEKEFSRYKILGLMNYISRGALAPGIEDKVFSLKKGEISPVLRGGNSFAIFKLEDRIPARTLSFEEAKKEIIEKLQNKAQDEEFMRVENELFTKYKVAFTKRGDLSSTKAEAKVDIRGRITKVVKAVKAQESELIGKIFIEGKGEEDTRFNMASVKVTGNTKILRQYKGRVLPATFDDLMAGQLVEVKFTGPVLQSYPVQAVAGKIVILQSVK